MAFNLANLQDKVASMQNSEQASTAYMQFIQRKGFFISDETAKSYSFTPSEDWKPYSHIFGSNEQETTGFLCKSPRLLVVKKSELTIVSKEGKVVGAFSKDLYNRQLHALKIRYAVIPVDANGNSLVSEAVLLPLKGAFQVSFSTALNDHRRQVQQLLRSLTHKSYSPDSEIWGYFVFQPTFKDVDSGYNKTMVSKVSQFKDITEENLQEMFLLDNPGIEALVKSGMSMELSYLNKTDNTPTEDLPTMPSDLHIEQKNSLNKFVEKFASSEVEDEDVSETLY